MNRLVTFLVCMSVALSGYSAELVLPVFAWQTPGAGGSVWSSEIYAVNEGDAPATFAWTDFLPNHQSGGCTVSLIAPITVEPGDTVLISGNEVAEELGCPDRALGALLVRTDGEIRITSRLANYRLGQPGCPYGDVLSGRSQTFHAVDTDQLAVLGSVVTLGGLVWHVNACAGLCVRSRVGLVNPTPEAVEAVIRPVGSWAADEIYVDGQPVSVPYSIVLAPRSWQLFEVNGPPLPWAGCFAPYPVTLQIQLSGPAVVYGTVVDVVARDAWTIQPIAMPPISPIR